MVLHSVGKNRIFNNFKESWVVQRTQKLSFKKLINKIIKSTIENDPQIRCLIKRAWDWWMSQYKANDAESTQIGNSFQNNFYISFNG